LISDDGSTDGSVAYLRSLTDARICIFEQRQNLGIFGNLNFLFARAHSPLTQILCQDDFLIGSNALETITAIWATLPAEIAFLRCNHRRDGSSRMMRLEEHMLPSVVHPTRSDLYFFLFGCIPGNLSNVSVRTRVVEEMGWYRTDLPYAGDFEFWSRVGRSRPWALSKAHVVQVRRHGEQASKTLNKKGELLPQLRLVLSGLFERLRAQGYEASDLRWFATTVYAAQHIHGGVMGAVRGHGLTYLKSVTQTMTGPDCFLGRGGSWLAYLLSVGGRFLGPTMAKRLSKGNIGRDWA
jgi:glycosyltransferase involved in cell wall biosynthesis